MSAPATYRSGTPRDQLPAVTRWHARLRGLGTAIHETSGLVNKNIHFDGIYGIWRGHWPRFIFLALGLH